MILQDEDSIILGDPAMHLSEQWNIVPCGEQIQSAGNPQAYRISPANSEGAFSFGVESLGYTDPTGRDIVLKRQCQPWIFQRLSRSGGEIHEVVSQSWSTNDSVPEIFMSYQI